MTDRCKWCGAMIRWALDEKGKRTPVEVARDGNMILLPVEPGKLTPRAQTVPPAGSGAIEIRTLRYQRHLPVCPANKGKQRKPLPQEEGLL